MNRKFEVEQNLGPFLSKMEKRCTEKDFYAKLLDQQDLDPENFRVATVQIPGEDWERPVILGEHALARANKRLFMGADRLMELVIRTLKNPMAGTITVKHPVTLVGNELVPVRKDGIDSTIVINDDERYTIVFQAGLSYIMVKTVWDNRDGRIRTSRTNAVLHISKTQTKKG